MSNIDEMMKRMKQEMDEMLGNIPKFGKPGVSPSAQSRPLINYNDGDNVHQGNPGMVNINRGRNINQGDLSGGMAGRDLIHHYGTELHDSNVTGDIVGGNQANFNSVENVRDFVSELEKLKANIEEAKNRGLLKKDGNDMMEKTVSEAIIQSSKPTPDKGKIVQCLEWAANIARAIGETVKAVKPILEVLVTAITVAKRIF